MIRYYLIIVFFCFTRYNYAANMEVRYSSPQNDSIPLKQISFQEADSILKEKHGVLNNEFTRPNLSKVFSLSDGTLLVVGKKACFIYNSANDVRRLMKIGPIKVSILYNLNHYGEKLPLMIDEAYFKLSTILGASSEKLDYTERSLEEVDRLLIDLQTKGRVNKEDLRKNVIYFIIYAGEVFNRKYQGNWSMIIDDNQQTWLPYILDKNNKRIDLFAWVYDSICNTSQDEISTITSGYYSKVHSFLKK